MSAFRKAVRKYLADRAEPEAALRDELPGNWSNVLVVPVRRETPEFLSGIEVAAGETPGRLLVIVVVNGTAGDAVTSRENEKFLQDVRAGCRGTVPVGEGNFVGDREAFDLLVIDRASPGRELPRRGGVGHARKIGTDLALALHAGGRVNSPWIHGSDGDAIQPADRFDLRVDDTSADVVAWTHPFLHEPSGDPDVDGATRLYDEWLRYHVAGLRYAASPWAFPTIGSTITVRADALAAVRGIPRREAAEDFYLLAKLAKVGKVATAPTGPVRLRARFSDRVPFGTGAGVERLRSDVERGIAPTLDHPECFHLLAAWQRALPLADPFKDGCFAELTARQRSALEGALERLHVRHAFASIPVPARRSWFDAFRTLKFLHHVRDAGFAPLPRAEAIERSLALGFDLSDLRDAWQRDGQRDVRSAAETTAGIQG